MNESILSRKGYGSAFNELRICGERLEKHARNAYGQQKLKLEMRAYKVFSQDVTMFPLAKIYSYEDSCLTMHYYRTHMPLWKVYRQCSKHEKDTILATVLRYLTLLHSARRISCTKEYYRGLLVQEVLEKVKVRFAEVKDIFEKNPFDSVNGVKCFSFDECLQRLESYLDRFLETKKDFFLCYIHGDPQFNNILYSNNLKDLVFIDPRGYFGDSKLYGIEEYDIAKVAFALSGYDVFDSMDCIEMSLEKGNITFPSFVLDSRFISFYPEIQFLLCSIWLGNSHCFRETPEKALISFAYARYLTTTLLS